MSKLINTLDNFVPKQHGENAHMEHAWSTEIQDKIVQFWYQCNRSEDIKRVAQLKNILVELLSQLHVQYDDGYYLNILYRMIGHTRDIISGKGEYTLAYMMIDVWADFNLELAKHALTCFVKSSDTDSNPYGSWKDIKYFCRYCLDNNRLMDHPIIQHGISLMNEQLRVDSAQFNTNDNSSISLVAKWIPREDSSFKVLYPELATQYFAEFIATAKTDESYARAITKCKTKYRLLIAKLNTKLDTTQIKQCDKQWSKIKFDNVTSITLNKQKKAFLNLKHNGTTKYPEDLDRINCSLHLKTHIANAITNGTSIKGLRIGMETFTKTALDIIQRRTKSLLLKDETDLLNLQWKNNSTQNNALSNFIAMVDVSGSMEGTPMHVANALGIRIAEKSKLGKRVMTFSHQPKWVNLENCDDFVSMTEQICTNSGLNTNFYAALDLILSAIITSKLEPVEVENMTLVILSDMQIDQGDPSMDYTMYEAIQRKYSETGIRLYGIPFKTPHIVFWNLRGTNGFPCLTTQTNTSMMSGYSPVILNTFCEEGLKSLTKHTPWTCLEKILMVDRYDVLGDRLK
jgi:hypothetical protein